MCVCMFSVVRMNRIKFGFANSNDTVLLSSFIYCVHGFVWNNFYTSVEQNTECAWNLKENSSPRYFHGICYSHITSVVYKLLEKRTRIKH